VKAGEKAAFVYMLREGECGVVFTSKSEEEVERAAAGEAAAGVAAGACTRPLFSSTYALSVGQGVH